MGDDPFVHITPTEEQIARMSEVRVKCRELYDLLLQSIPNGRERSLAITALEECGMWSSKAITRHPMENRKAGDGG